jgi:hypothetical protein
METFKSYVLKEPIGVVGLITPWYKWISDSEPATQFLLPYQMMKICLLCNLLKELSIADGCMEGCSSLGCWLHCCLEAFRVVLSVRVKKWFNLLYTDVLVS